MEKIKFNTLIEILLYSIMACMFLFAGILTYTFIILQEARPLENVTANFSSPISLAEDTEIHATGTFDRRIVCNITDFNLFFKSESTTDIIVLTPSHLLNAPTTSVAAGSGLPIELLLSIPSTLYPGRWAVEFHGSYICRKGIFTAVKTQTILANSITVVE